MRKLLLTSAAVFALTASPSMLLAQNAPAGDEVQTPAESTSPRPVPPPTSPGPTATGPSATSTGVNSGGQTSGQGSSTAGTQGGPATAQQRSVYSGWPADRRGEFDALPAEQQTYYWTLSQDQQEGFWALTPDQRTRLFNMSPEQRQSAWRSIMQQLQGQDSTSPMGQSSQPGTAGSNTAGSTQGSANMPANQAQPAGIGGGTAAPPPAEAMNKDYPVCSRTVQDSCRNPGGK